MHFHFLTTGIERESKHFILRWSSGCDHKNVASAERSEFGCVDEENTVPTDDNHFELSLEVRRFEAVPHTTETDDWFNTQVVLDVTCISSAAMGELRRPGNDLGCNHKNVVSAERSEFGCVDEHMAH